MPRDIALFLVLVAVGGGGVVAAVVFAIGGNGNGGNSACDQPRPAVDESDISQEGFEIEDAGLARVIEAASAGDLEAAETWFLGDVHNFTRNVDAPLRVADEGLARDLCEAVISIEEELALDRRPDAIASQAKRIRSLLREAAVALEYERPGR